MQQCFNKINFIGHFLIGHQIEYEKNTLSIKRQNIQLLIRIELKLHRIVECKKHKKTS